MKGDIVSVTITHSIRGRIERATRTFEEVPLEEALASMFQHLKQGAWSCPTEFNQGLLTIREEHGVVIGSHHAVYGNIANSLWDFLATAGKPVDYELGSPEHDQFLRRTLLEKCGLKLSPEEEERALELPEDEFFTALVMVRTQSEFVRLIS